MLHKLRLLLKPLPLYLPHQWMRDIECHGELFNNPILNQVIM